MQRRCAAAEAAAAKLQQQRTAAEAAAVVAREAAEAAHREETADLLRRLARPVMCFVFKYRVLPPPVANKSVCVVTRQASYAYPPLCCQAARRLEVTTQRRAGAGSLELQLCDSSLGVCCGDAAVATAPDRSSRPRTRRLRWPSCRSSPPRCSSAPSASSASGTLPSPPRRYASARLLQEVVMHSRRNHCVAIVAS